VIWIPHAFLLLFILWLCFNGAPFATFDTNSRWWTALLNPGNDLCLLGLFFVWWLEARAGVYLGQAGVMVRAGTRRIVVPWQEIAYAEVDEVPKYPVTRRRRPCLALVLVAPSGERRALPARLPPRAYMRRWENGPAPSGERRPLPAPLPASKRYWGFDPEPFAVLSRARMAQVVNRINEMASLPA
jgi:hypothetical protein